MAEIKRQLETEISLNGERVSIAGQRVLQLDDAALQAGAHRTKPRCAPHPCDAKPVVSAASSPGLIPGAEPSSGEPH